MSNVYASPPQVSREYSEADGQISSLESTAHPYLSIACKNGEVLRGDSGLIKPQHSLSRGTSKEDIGRKLLRWSFYTIPFSAGATTPIAGALNVQGKEACGSIFFVVGMTYLLDLIVFGLWAHFTSKATLAENWHAVGHFVFQRPSLHWFCLAGGVLGASQHIILSLVSASGGVSIYTLGCLSGAILSGMILDFTGFCWARKVKPNFLVLSGALAVILGAILHSLPSLRGNVETSRNTLLLCLFLSAISGLFMCLQACAGLKLASLIGGFRRAAAWSLFSGSLMMHVLGPYIVPNAPIVELLRPKNWWKMTQAPLAAYSLVAVAVCQRRMSGAMVYCWFVIGQLVSSTVLDTLGWIGLTRRPINVYKIIGLLVVLLGVIAVTVSKLWRRPSPSFHPPLDHSPTSPHQSCVATNELSSLRSLSAQEKVAEEEATCEEVLFVAPDSFPIRQGSI